MKFDQRTSITVKPVMRGHLKKCPYMTGVPSSQVHFNVKVYFGSQKMWFRHSNLDILVSPRHRFYCIDILWHNNYINKLSLFTTEAFYLNRLLWRCQHNTCNRINSIQYSMIFKAIQTRDLVLMKPLAKWMVFNGRAHWTCITICFN